MSSAYQHTRGEHLVSPPTFKNMGFLATIFMNIAELTPNAKVLNLVATITRLDEVRVIPPSEKQPKELHVQDGVLEDATDQVLFALWEQQIGQFRVGDLISLEEGWAKRITADDHPHQGDLQVSTGKFGKIHVVPPEHPE